VICPRVNNIKNDNVQTSLLSLAAHYLTLALSISDATVAESISHAAILHNLALAYTALGDYESAVPILLRATSSGHEHFATTKPYWNVPGQLLQIMEMRAMLIGATVSKKKSNNKMSKKKRIPFLPFHEDRK
jgi:tetratricopeptide (TPR) repeat protein